MHLHVSLPFNPSLPTDLANSYKECKMAVCGAVEGLLAKAGLRAQDVVRLCAHVCVCESTHARAYVIFAGSQIQRLTCISLHLMFFHLPYILNPPHTHTHT